MTSCSSTVGIGDFQTLALVAPVASTQAAQEIPKLCDPVAVQAAQIDGQGNRLRSVCFQRDGRGKMCKIVQSSIPSGMIQFQ